MTVAGYRNFPPAGGGQVRSPMNFVFTAAAMKSRPMRSAASAAAGSATVVRCSLRSRSPARPIVRMMRVIFLRP